MSSDQQPTRERTKREYAKINIRETSKQGAYLKDDIIERIADIQLRYERVLELLSGRRPEAKTTLDWLLKKRLITPAEHVAGSALALLLEWRRASIGPEDSTVAFARKYIEGSAA